MYLVSKIPAKELKKITQICIYFLRFQLKSFKKTHTEDMHLFPLIRKNYIFGVLLCIKIVTLKH